MLARRLLRFVVDSLLILAAGAIASVLLFRLAPGADTDERLLDSRLSERSRAAIIAERERSHSLTGRSAARFAAMVKGDFGVSEMSGTPVTELLRDRAPGSLSIVASGATIGFLAGSFAAVASILLLPKFAEVLAAAGFLSLLSLPAGLLTLFAVFGRVPLEFAVGASVAPRIYFYASRLLGQHRVAPYVLGAVAAGVGPVRIALFHVMPVLRSEFAALAGFAVITALAASIPAEVLSGRPGVGQLAWKSAMDRDLPVVLAVTIMMILVSRLVTLLSALPARDLRPSV